MLRVLSTGLWAALFLAIPFAATWSASAMAMEAPAYSHIVVVVMENQDYGSIIGNKAAPFINQLTSSGALLTNYSAVSHPSLPNHYALYAGQTFGISDDAQHSLSGATLATILRRAGMTFQGYVEHPRSKQAHNPWESFPEGQTVERDFKDFPQRSYDGLPTVAFVIPNLDNDMHDGSIARGDHWLSANIGGYAQWATANNSLLIVLWDESRTYRGPNRVAAILYGAHIAMGSHAAAANHYNVLSTILASYGLPGPGLAASAPPLGLFAAPETTPSPPATVPASKPHSDAGNGRRWLAGGPAR
jgi:phosphatidylinositol-3-phosphatase